MSTNPPKIKITQQEINDIYEITKEEPFPKVQEVPVHPESIKPQELQTEEEWEQKMDDDIGAVSEEEYNKQEEEEEEALGVNEF